MNISEKGKQAKEASRTLAALDFTSRQNGLECMKQALKEHKEAILSANQKDLKRAEEEGLDQPLLKRLKFDEKKLQDVIDGIDSLLQLEDPIGQTLQETELAPGLILDKVRVPLGVLGIIFESRPDAFVQISSLALKSGNAVMLKGGREALETNRALYQAILDASQAADLPEGWIQNLESREEVNDMLSLDQYLDLIIPRGSNQFVQYIMNHSSIPVMGHADGICHTYIDKDADLDKAVAVAVDAKTQYPSVCNATETLLVHQDIAEDFLPAFQKALKIPTVLKGDTATRLILPVEEATEDDWKTEYLDYILSIRIVNSVNEAIDHINNYGSGHTDSIVTENKEAEKAFTSLVDSACVFVNASTRFSDGFRFGFGAEVGVSTSKLHARGPVGLEGLCTYKYILRGSGDIVADFAEGDRSFTHKKLK